MTDMDLLLRLRLRCYGEQLKTFLRRYQHALLFAFLMSLLAGAQLQDAVAIGRSIGAPVLAVVNSNASFVVSFASALFIQILFVAWITFQKSAVLGNPLSHFTLCLPISEEAGNRIDKESKNFLVDYVKRRKNQAVILMASHNEELCEATNSEKLLLSAVNNCTSEHDTA